MTQPYIANAKFDLAFIIGPAFVVTLIAILAAPWAQSLANFPVWLWVILILGVDVSHVYSTLFRTYFDRDELRLRPRLYQLAPLLLWVTGAVLYSFDSLVFWRGLAYLAIFHFVRQQYGFMLIYGRREKGNKRIDKAAIYGATILPLVYWLSHPRSFNWFVDGDVVSHTVPYVFDIAALLYAVVLAAYLWQEVLRWRETRTINLPKNLLLLGTGLSWGVGIVAFDNDIIFTATNVVAHGIPYIALNWLYGKNRQTIQTHVPYIWSKLAWLFRPTMIPIYIGTLALLAFIEEGLWDGFVWHDHQKLFQTFSMLPAVDDPAILVWLVPLLSLPQSTHYVLDAFIWRKNGNVPDFKRILFGQQP
ncbi:hypothetical protein AEAC466_17530 [Asticcacaulis sp. AC466]|uniref:hypothetical protein n=1 Tax=Asticcacaulis sp. AC466 TaxID=1282362 RepID=UPI0003C3C0A2|nr:hypothetical protein [Asticcacaulis sp. AC466]ESQ82422.1 hypothetical protein AEAC466_17530 [Asticcacaulis sp. AC466]